MISRALLETWIATLQGESCLLPDDAKEMSLRESQQRLAVLQSQAETSKAHAVLPEKLIASRRAEVTKHGEALSALRTQLETNEKLVSELRAEGERLQRRRFRPVGQQLSMPCLSTYPRCHLPRCWPRPRRNTKRLLQQRALRDRNRRQSWLSFWSLTARWERSTWRSSGSTCRRSFVWSLRFLRQQPKEQRTL